MNKWIFILLALGFTLGVHAQKFAWGSNNWGVQAQKVEYTPEDSVIATKLLEDAKTERGEESRTLYFGKKLLGTPYESYTMEVGDEEHLVVNLRKLDCTTFIETVVALALCDKQNKRTFKDYCKNLMKVRYRNGKITDYTSRLHYFTWWAEDNEKLGIVEDIAPKKEPWGPFTAVQTVSMSAMSAHPELYKHLKDNPEFVARIKKYEDDVNGRQYRYIPKKNIAWGKNTSLSIVKDGDIVAMVNNKIDVCHLGMVFWQNGRLHLIHSSSLYKKVVLSKGTYYEYEIKQPRHLGIRVLRFKD